MGIAHEYVMAFIVRNFQNFTYAILLGNSAQLDPHSRAVRDIVDKVVGRIPSRHRALLNEQLHADLLECSEELYDVLIEETDILIQILCGISTDETCHTRTSNGREKLSCAGTSQHVRMNLVTNRLIGMQKIFKASQIENSHLVATRIDDRFGIRIAQVFALPSARGTHSKVGSDRIDHCFSRCIGIWSCQRRTQL